MMLLIIDCESSGLPRDELPPLAAEQPHMVQLGAQLFDLAGRRRGHLSVLIRPSGWGIEAAAQTVHGISADDCARYGIKLAVALLALRDMVANATRIVGHNVQFDRKMIALALHRQGADGTWWAKAGSLMVCTMEAATDSCRLPAEYGGYKWPSLSEAVSILVPGRAGFESRHDADADIDATAELYHELVKLGAIKPQADPYARDF